MINKNKVVFILIDALRSDYITKEDSPFLYNFAKTNKYYENVTQSRSFCERAEIFTGLSPRESGYFTAIGFSPEDSPYKDIKILDILAYPDKLFFKNRLYNIFRNKLIRLLTIGKNILMKSYYIPVNTLKYFNLTEDKFDFRLKNGFDGQNNIFNDCKVNGLNIYYDSFTALNFTKPSTDESRLKLVEENIENDYNLYLSYIGIIDSSGHKYGPKSKEIKSELKKLDQRLSEFYNNIVLNNKDTKFIFLGDHGMTKVHTHVNIEKELNELAIINNLKLGKDYIYFLDSTMFRIWYLNDNALKCIDNNLKCNQNLLKNGTFVNKSIAIEKEIPFPDKQYGDTLWMANVGVLIFPDFFHKSNPYKGMHGYDVDDLSSKGTCFVSSKKYEYTENIKLTDVYNILKKELNI
jgi:predicted AlkP superfamily pyrophosphatase or phosphodiesterase